MFRCLALQVQKPEIGVVRATEATSFVFLCEFGVFETWVSSQSASENILVMDHCHCLLESHNLCSDLFDLLIMASNNRK